MNLPLVELAPGLTVPRIGIGTWGIGGYLASSKFTDDKEDIKQIQFQIEQGLTAIEVWDKQGGGNSLKVLSNVVAPYNRENLTLFAQVDTKYFNTKQDLENNIENYLSKLGVNYVDVLQIHSPKYGELGVEGTVCALCETIKKGKAKYLSISNASIDQIKEAQKYSEYKIIANEVDYNLVDRSVENNGIMEYCRRNGMRILAAKPLARGMVGYLWGMQGMDLIYQLCEKYAITSTQLAIAWLLSKPDVMLWIKSTNRSHINENLAACEVKLEAADIKMLDEWRFKVA